MITRKENERIELETPRRNEQRARDLVLDFPGTAYTVEELMKCVDEPRVNRVTKSNCVGALMQDEYRRVTKTLAKSMFLLKDVDLGSLTRQYASPNPHYRSGPSMLLYSIRAVMLSAQEKYGSFEKLETEKERLEEKAAVRKRKLEENARIKLE